MKPGILAIALGPKKKGEEPDGDEGGDDMDAKMVKAAQDALDAIKADDAEALSAALEEHYRCCRDAYGDDGEPEGEDEEAA